ncbi:MAG: cell division protein SepF [Candidatus Bathyarchaeales archaeon]
MPSLSNPFRKSKKEEKETAKIGAEMVQGKTFLKAMPLRDLADLDAVKNEVRSGNILILRITPLANKNVEDVKRAVNELCEFATSIGGDIARLGEERIVICPPNVKIWREKASVASEPIPTAA